MLAVALLRLPIGGRGVNVCFCPGKSGYGCSRGVPAHDHMSLAPIDA